ncbi:MAG: conjugal transfer protein TraF [bacterium]
MAKQFFKTSLCLLTFIFLSTSVYAVEFQPIGFEPLSMGGAGVAAARGGTASYYNSALLLENLYDTHIDFPVGGGIREINITRHIDRLSEIGIDETIQNIKNNVFTFPGSNTIEDRNNISEIKNILRSVSAKNGLQLMPSATLGIQMYNFGFGINGISEASAYAVIDDQRLDLIIQDPLFGQYFEYNETTDMYTLSDANAYALRSMEYALDNDLTYMKLTGLAYTEIFFSHARKFKSAPGVLNLGASVKIMPGYAFDEKINIDTKSGEIDSELSDCGKSSISWGIDLGALYKPPKIEKLALGLVIKNLNTPQFKTKTGNTLELKPQVRTGISYNFWYDRIMLAIDADLTKNNTFIPGYESQFIGGGLNFNPNKWLFLRAGVMRNIRDSEEGAIFTAGLGFGLEWLQLDIAGQMSSKKTSFDQEKIPNYARFLISLISKW